MQIFITVRNVRHHFHSISYMSDIQFFYYLMVIPTNVMNKCDIISSFFHIVITVVLFVCKHGFSKLTLKQLENVQVQSSAPFSSFGTHYLFSHSHRTYSHSFRVSYGISAGNSPVASTSARVARAMGLVAS